VKQNTNSRSEAKAGGQQQTGEERATRRSIALDIAGGDLMLQGHFSDWESGLAIGPDLDRVGLKLAIDATSVANDARVSEDGSSLFSFHSRDVKTTGPARYRAVGTFTGPRGARAMEIEVSSPVGHTALVVVSFSAKRQDFGTGWHDLIANVVPFVDEADGTPTRPAHAWLIPPALASA
jgi:polyisoprenoid-binding protein YceI